jgi:hypothetical protein
MGDDSRKSIVQALKNEWSLFLEAFQKEDQPSDGKSRISDSFEASKLELLGLNEVRELMRALTDDRKKLNQKLESINKEIDLNTAKLESLRLVGAEDSEILKRIHELNDLGQSVANALGKVDRRLRAIRQKEDALQQQTASI